MVPYHRLLSGSNWAKNYQNLFMNGKVIARKSSGIFSVTPSGWQAAST